MLVPKSGDSNQLKNWRPISLINADSKMFAHVLANLLKSSLRRLTNPDQIADLKGRQMTNANIYLKNMCDNRTNGISIIATLDFCKAFDRVDQDYMLRLIKHVGFPPKIYNMIDQNYRDTKSNILVNIFLTKDIAVERGVEQGCSLSALLFIITLEPLLQMLRDNKHFKGMQQSEPTKKLVAYADDLTLIAADNEDIGEAIKTVNHFIEGTQFQPNEDKTEIPSF